VVGAFVNPNDMTRNSEKALVIPEQCLHHIVWAHQHLLVARLQVKLGEELHALDNVMKNHHDTSLFLAKSTSTENADELSRMTPLCNMASHCCSSSAFCVWT
jgi:hypothetical protein